MKFYAVLALVGFAFLATLFASSSATNSTWGYIGPYDAMLYRENVVAKSSFMQVHSRNVVYPAGGYINTRTITGIKAIDLMRKHGGRASLLRGGPGQRNVTLHLKSERGEALNFTIEIWGR